MDILKGEILEDGTISIKTSEISEVNHVSVDQLLSDIADIAGGEHRREKNPDNPGSQFFKNKRVLRGGKIQTLGGK